MRADFKIKDQGAEDMLAVTASIERRGMSYNSSHSGGFLHDSGWDNNPSGGSGSETEDQSGQVSTQPSETAPGSTRLQGLFVRLGDNPLIESTL